MAIIKEFYPLQDQYGGGGGGGGGLGGSGGGSSSTKTTPSGVSVVSKSTLKTIYSIEQDVDSSDGVEIYKTTATEGRASYEAPKEIHIENVGDGALGVIIQVPQWTADATIGASNDLHTSLQMILGVGEKFICNTTKIVSLYTGTIANDKVFMDGTTQASFTDTSGTLYVDSGTTLSTDFENSEDHIDVTDGDFFRVGDLIQLGIDDTTATLAEVMRITSIVDTAGDGAFTPAQVFVDRGLYGRTTLVDKDAQTNATNGAVSGAKVYFPTFNIRKDYGTYSTAQTDASGVYHAKNFFGLGRAATIGGGGILPGSLGFLFYEAGYQELGLKGVTPQTETGLAKSTVYYMTIAVDGGSSIEISFTSDASDTTFGKIVSQLQSAIDALYYVAGNLFEKSCIISFVNGDIRFTSTSRLSTSAIALTAGTTGGSAATNFFAQANGRIPILADIQTAVAAITPTTTMFDKDTHMDKPNVSKMAWDDGKGNIVGVASGSIDYDTGEIILNSVANASFKYVVSHKSGLSGRSNVQGSNLVELVYARAVNHQVNSRIKIEVLG
tara:strand:- start:36910 stop:38571 length:1662 start_codon:yes stop_codon:yes gene_type:complete